MALADKEQQKTSVVKFSERRKFFAQTAQGVGVSALAGLLLSAYLNEAKANRQLLRPPGAIGEEEFLNKCIKCGQCVVACPYDTLTLAKPGDALPVGTPYFKPRITPCYMCPEVYCVPACPTDALDKKLVSNNQQELDINQARMGLAILDIESCVAYWGIQCEVCYRVCPLIDKAITLEYRQNERTGKHAFLLPVVNSEFCTGCGICEKACITQKSAIFVLNRKIAQGEVGAHYLRGWVEADDEKIKQIQGEKINTTIRSRKKAIDYLNE